MKLITSQDSEFIAEVKKKYIKGPIVHIPFKPHLIQLLVDCLHQRSKNTYIY